MQQKPPILYSFRRCPYAMRARMGIAQAGITVELREIVLRDKPAHMLEISPKGTVPVLLLPDGTVIEESLEIMRWALHKNDPDGWLNADKAGTQSLIERNDGPFKNALDRYKYPSRFPAEACSDARERGLEIVQVLNARLETRQNLMSDAITLADIAIFPFIRQFAHINRDWFYALKLPRIQNWLTRHLDSQLFQMIMEKYKPWRESDPARLRGRIHYSPES